MTTDEKLAVIAGNLRAADELSEKYESYVSGAVFELVRLSLAFDSAEDALNMARLVIPNGERTALAHFCRCYCRYAEALPQTFPLPEYSENGDTVMIPEIARLENAVNELNARGMKLECVYGDSFSSCAESVEYGHAHFALMPMTDPGDGRLRSFDRLRERFGLKIHRVLSIREDDGGIYSYQLCALGFPDVSREDMTRFSFTADVNSCAMAYLEGVRVFGASVITADVSSGEVSRVCAVLEVSGLDENDLSGLIMYLGADADLTVDGYYAEMK
ncbi:MAG: hypothetical protein E7578_08980 [Ruminococcaceae bacterium]|nr:hypothetical protein [Oscillospiraceae bacterium]